MKYTPLGATGLEVSRLVLGCMGYGTPSSGNQAWSLDEEDSRQLIKQAVDAGINFFDTANVYSACSSEEILGRAIADLVPREDVVIASKVQMRMRPGPNGMGLSRKVIMRELDDSLRRLGTDYIDLYQIHRWNPQTPIEETMAALHDAVTSGKVRYIGASSMWAWQFSKAQHTATANGWTRFVSMQNHYNLLYREEEREMLPLCIDLGVGVIPWSPLARGLLTRPWSSATARSSSDKNGMAMYGTTDQTIVDAVAAVAAERGVSPAQVGLAWHHSKNVVTAPIVGATNPRHLDDAIASVDLTLSADEIELLESPYEPHSIAGHK